MQKSPQEEDIMTPHQDLSVKITEEFTTQLKLAGDEVTEEEEDEDEEEEEEFSFVCGANMSPVAAEDAFSDGQIKTIYPLFNRDLLLSDEDFRSLHENLPVRPSVKKVFVETNDGVDGLVASSSSENGDVSGPYCDWSTRKAVEASPEVCKKSNSTGFSKIWRFKEFLGRSNSDGRDAFVFLNNNDATQSQAAPAAVAVIGGEKKESTVKVKKNKKGKTAPLSAHEVYLKSKAKEDRRRSYLPYRPELMGFFTSVNGGGLTRNIHPF